MTQKISVDAIKMLREKTNASINDVKQALESANGNESKALAWLRERGAAISEQRQGRATGQGRVEAYVHHNGMVGAVIEVNCETDFVARTPEFVQFCRDLAMHVVWAAPKHVKVEAALAETGIRPEECLLQQPFVKDQGVTVNDLLKSLIATTGENVVIRRFARFAVGESTPSAS